MSRAYDRCNREVALIPALRTSRRRPPRLLAIVFAALGDPTRLLLLAKLSRASPLSIAQLTRGSRLTRQAVTKHLRVLEQAGLVRNLHRGRESLFVLAPAPLRTARAHLDSFANQ